MLAVVRRLLARGHEVRVMSDPCNREEVLAAGASFVPWTRAPHRADKSTDTDPIRDWEVKSPPAMIGRLRDRMFVGPSLAYAEDVLDELKQFPADVVVSSEMLLGAMAAAEAAKVPCVGLSANVYLFPRPGVPPFGPGLMPATSVFGRLRDWIVKTIAMREFGKGTAAFNETRRTIGLGPLAHPFDQVTRLARHLVLTSAAFDFQPAVPNDRIIYAGPELDDPAWVAPWRSPWNASDARPLVVVGFSTTYQNQIDALRRVTHALEQLNVRAVLTTGPAVDPSALPSTPNVHVCASAPHGWLLKEAAVAITHGGHGTVIRALAAGVPLVCMPMGRDQNENAARVVHRGAGVRLSPGASSEEIRNAVRTILDDPTYREHARTLGELIARDARESQAIDILEATKGSRGSQGAQGS